MLGSSTPDGLAPLSFDGALTIVFVFGGLGVLWAAWNWFALSRISTVPDADVISSKSGGQDNIALVIDIGARISDGAK